MRPSPLAVAVATLLLMPITVAAQQAEPPAETQAERGLSDLTDAVRQLEDAPAEASQPIEPAPPEPAQSQPAAPEPAPAPAPPAEPAPPTPAPALATGTPSAPAARPAPLTRAQLAELDATAARGRLLVAIARGGLIATRDMLSRISNPGGAGIAGWIAEPAGNAVSVTFYANRPDGPVTVFRADVIGGRVTERQIHLTGGPALNPLQARMVAARAATDSLDHAACANQPFNVLVVPPASVDAPVDVYQITPPSQEARIPFGGHFKTTIAADGSVAATRGFSRNCLTVAVPATPAGQQPRPIAVTHLLDPTPTEVHVLLAALAGRPVLVATGEPSRIWAVTSERIAEVRD